MLLTDERIAFQEEENNLNNINSKIQNAISREISVIERIDEELKDFYSVDYDDYDKKRELYIRRKSSDDMISELSKNKDCPYFSHIDMNIDNKNSETFFVGKKSIDIDGKIVVVDYRSPMGQTYYVNNQTKFNIKNHDYQMLLKRKVDISSGKLINVFTEYDIDEVSLDGNVVDPFLLSILKEKKRDYKLTDIIRTIQSNQNDIITKPLKENFVLQGCAGSGKTMILLHRLSYLIYNNKSFSFNRSCILTPNEFFNMQIDEISSELEIDKITRYTVEEYFAELIDRFSKTDTMVVIDENGNSIKQTKIGPINSKVRSEKILDEELLRSIYSNEFRKVIIKEYNSVWEKVKKYFVEHADNELFKKYGETLPSFSRYKINTYDAANNILLSIKNKIETQIRLYDENEESLIKNQKSIEESDKKIIEYNYKVDKFREDSILLLNARIKTISQEHDDKSKRLNELNDARNNKVVQLKELSEDLNNSSIKFELPDGEVLNYSYIMENDNEVTDFIKEKYNEYITLISQKKEVYDNIPIYNFGRRNRAKSELEASIAVFESASLNGIKKQIGNVEKLKLEVEQIQNEISIINSQITELSDFCKKIYNEVEILNTGLDFVKKSANSDLKALLDSKNGSLVKPYVVSYVNVLRELRQEKEKNKRLNDSCAKYKRDIDVYLNKNISEKDIEHLDELLEELTKIDYCSLDRMVKTLLQTEYEKYNNKYNEQTNYRHKLYLKLLLCSLYYIPRVPFENFVNIDEAQDLAVSEYRLLKDILGDICVFNLYGDVNQLIYEYKGIQDWKDIDFITTNNLYFLNENYRNTKQITDYCNKKFDANIFAIGVDGPEVKDLEIEQAIFDAVNSKRNNPEYRIALIYKRGTISSKQLERCLEKYDVFSVGKILPDKISVITIEDAKGLEFEKVYALDIKTSANEKYISYTRALIELIIVSSGIELWLKEQIVNDDSKKDSVINEKSNTEENDMFSKIRNLIKNNKTIGEISKELNISIDAVMTLLKELS